MGYLTTFTVYNDGCDLIKKYPQEFADKIYYACSNTSKSQSIGLGGFANMIEAQKTRHADDRTCYVHLGNTVTEMNYYSSETKNLMKTNRKFFEDLLKEMDFHSRKLKAQLRQIKEAEKIQELTNKFLGIPASLFRPDGWVEENQITQFINEKELDYLYKKSILDMDVDKQDIFNYLYKFNIGS